MVVFLFATELNIPPSETYDLPASLVNDLLSMYTVAKEIESDEMNKHNKDMDRIRNSMR
tara:strand:- start:214 stop:390 length:177 start_codon:yes stop_codon:yes gene_type:complete